MPKLKLQVLLVPPYLAAVPTTMLEPQHTKRFLHLVDPTHDLKQVEVEICGRYRKLYPDEQELIIDKVQDKDLCDLDPDYTVEDVFQSGDLIRVITNNHFTVYPLESGPYNSFRALELAQSTPMPTAPILVNDGTITSRKRTDDYFHSYNNQIPQKSHQTGKVPKTPSLNIKKVRRTSSPKIAPIEDESNISLPPPDEVMDKSIPQKSVNSSFNELPPAQKRITSGMLNMPPHARLETDEIMHQTSRKSSFNNNLISTSSSSDDQYYESDHNEHTTPSKSIAKIPRNSLPNQSQMITASSPKVSKKSLINTSGSKILEEPSSASEIDSDSDSKDDEDYTREAATYKDPLSQLNTVSKDEVIDIFKHRIVKKNKKNAEANELKERSHFQKVMLGNLSIDMVDAPKTSEYRGTRSSRKIADEPPRRALKTDNTPRKEASVPVSTGRRKSSLPKATELLKVEKNNVKPKTPKPAVLNNEQLNQLDVTKAEVKPKEPVKKLQVVFEKMKNFEQKLNSLLVNGEVFPKKITAHEFQNSDDDEDDDVYGEDELIINPRVCLHTKSSHKLKDSSHQEAKELALLNPSQDNSYPEAVDGVQGKPFSTDAVPMTPIVTTVAHVSESNPPFLLNGPSADANKLNSNGKPIPAFNITGSIRSTHEVNILNSELDSAVSRKIIENNIESINNGNDIAGGNGHHRMEELSITNHVPPSPRKRRLSSSQQNQIKNTPLRELNTSKNVERSEHDKLKERAEKLKLSKLHRMEKVTVNITPKRKFADSTSEDSDDSSSEDEGPEIEPKRPRLVTSAPTQKSQSPIPTRTPFTSRTQNSNIVKNTDDGTLGVIDSSSKSKPTIRDLNANSVQSTTKTPLKTPVSKTPINKVPTGSSIRKLTSLVDLALRGVPEVKEPTKHVSHPVSKLKSIIDNDSDESSSDSYSSSSDASDNENNEDDAKFLSLKKVSGKDKPKKKTNLFRTLKR